MIPYDSPLQDNAKDPRWHTQLFDRLVLVLLAVCGAISGVALLIAPHFVLPAEDAVIVFQYSRNLEQTGAITFIASGPRTEGATDFAWMALISLGMKLGANPFWLATSISTISLVLLAYPCSKSQATPSGSSPCWSSWEPLR